MIEVLQWYTMYNDTVYIVEWKKLQAKKNDRKSHCHGAFYMYLKSIYIFLFLFCFFFLFCIKLFMRKESDDWKVAIKYLVGITSVFKTFSIFLVLPSLSAVFFSLSQSFCFLFHFFFPMVSLCYQKIDSVISHKWVKLQHIKSKVKLCSSTIMVNVVWNCISDSLHQSGEKLISFDISTT